MSIADETERRTSEAATRMRMSAAVPVSFGRRLAELADVHPEQAAIIFEPRVGDERRVSWRELDRASNRVARLLAAHGTDAHSTVVVGLPNCPEHYIATFAVWKLGALPLTLRPAMPDRERDALLELVQPTVVLADWVGPPFPMLRPSDMQQADRMSDAPLPDRVSNPGKALASGGSTGRPKIIISPGPWARVPGNPVPFLGAAGFGMGHTQLVAGPLYHSAPFLTSYQGLFDDNTLVLLEKFDAARAVALIERHRVQSMYLPPILMQRIAALPDVQMRDFSSVRAVVSTAAPCPPWLKRFWIGLVGAPQVAEVFSATEGVGRTVIRGDEWLEHPGSVGRPFATELRILDEAWRDLRAGQIGEIFMRPQGPATETYRYLGVAPATSTPDGFVSVGDLGWLDEAGYLFIADRRTDLVITGGANVYPAEVEAALTEHPAIADVAVIGVPDAEWGKRVHAVVQPRVLEAPPTVADLDLHLRDRLSTYKAPKTYEFVADFPRDDAGKIQRSALAAARASGWLPGMIRVKPAR